MASSKPAPAIRAACSDREEYSKQENKLAQRRLEEDQRKLDLYKQRQHQESKKAKGAVKTDLFSINKTRSPTVEEWLHPSRKGNSMNREHAEVGKSIENRRKYGNAFNESSIIK